MKLLQWFRAESAYDDQLQVYRQRADRVMVGMNVFLTLVCLAIAPYRGTWSVALLVGIPTLVLSYALMRHSPGALVTRLYMACAFMAYTSLIIHQSAGDIEAHFSAFGLIGVLLYYRDWRTIFAATVFIYFQHLVAGYAQTQGVPVYVFDTPAFWSVFALHVAYFLPFVGMMGFLSVWLRKEGYEQQRIIAQGQAREVELREAMARAEVAHRLKSQILANMSHEIRTPLNGVGGMLQLVLDSPLDAQQREHLQLAQESSEHLLGILNDILDFSKIEAGSLDLESVPTDLRQLLHGVIRAFQPQADQKKLLLTSHCTPAVPGRVCTDPVRVRQILNNLIGNALKFTHTGGVSVEIDAHNVTGANRCLVKIRVSDTGIGFDPQMADSLFQPFVQADSSSTRLYGGAGLGLAITRSLLQSFGGSISASSSPGKGAVFKVSLPCQLPEPTSEVEAITGVAVPRRAAVSLNLLLAEDHPVNQKVMSLMLEKLGHAVTLAPDGRCALEFLSKQTFDLVLLDVMMPEMDGLGVLAHLRERERLMGRHTPVIMVTAHAMTGDAEKFLAAGADGYLSKPVSVERLEAEISRLLSAELAPPSHPRARI